MNKLLRAHADAIIASSREKYSRPRTEVETEIKETIEQSEKYKKELSDSGRAAGEAGAGNNDRLTDGQEISISHDSPVFQYQPVQKPNKPAKKPRPATPKDDFRRQNLSPDAAEGKTDRPTLKDLGKMVAEKQGNEKPENHKPENQGSTKSKKPYKHYNKNRHHYKKGPKAPNNSSS